jgi:hypothetical protein
MSGNLPDNVTQIDLDRQYPDTKPMRDYSLMNRYFSDLRNKKTELNYKQWLEEYKKEANK